jgi:hypothetical protein
MQKGMIMRSTSRLLLLLTLGLSLSACSPNYNWRESSDNGAHFTILLPAKPASIARNIDLDGIKVDMIMTAAEVDGISFAVGTAELPSPEQAVAALKSMQTALLKNIDGTARPDAMLPGKTENTSARLDLEARGMARGQPLRLTARLLAKDRRVYQVIMLGPEKAFRDENVETFFSSFKPM